MSQNQDKLFEQIVRSAEEGKAISPRAFDIKEKFNYADKVIVISGKSDRHAIGLTDRILKDLREKLQIKPSYIEGYKQGHWIILDFFDIIVHVFYNPQRELYDLETLLKECPAVDLTEIIRSVEQEAAA